MNYAGRSRTSTQSVSLRQSRTDGRLFLGGYFIARQADCLDPDNLRHRVFYALIKKRDLRHIYASLLLQRGESPVYVKEHLEHSSISITVDLYGHLIPGGIGRQ